MKVVILCGGQGTRIRDVSEIMPKPMLPIGDKPIVWHIMKHYARYGLNEFILCLGHKGWMIKEFFINFRAMVSDCTVEIGRPETMTYHSTCDEADWKVTLADTGEHAGTGARVRKILPYLDEDGDSSCCLTYGDGLSTVDIDALLKHHHSMGLAGTITGVKIPGRFGELTIEKNRVAQFSEKPVVSAGRINGGFMIFQTEKLKNYLIPGETLIFERQPLESMVRDQQLAVYNHDGYWQCMDTLREYNQLNELWNSGRAPWVPSEPVFYADIGSAGNRPSGNDESKPLPSQSDEVANKKSAKP